MTLLLFGLQLSEWADGWRRLGSSNLNSRLDMGSPSNLGFEAPPLNGVVSITMTIKRDPNPVKGEEHLHASLLSGYPMVDRTQMTKAANNDIVLKQTQPQS